jgi:hypothetical protein
VSLGFKTRHRCLLRTFRVLLRSSSKERTVPFPHSARVNLKATPPVPVDIPPPARVVGPIPHFRKFSFLIGVTVTVLALVLINQIIALML